MDIFSNHYVVIRKEERAKLRSSFGVSDSAISDSLNYRRNSLLSRRIRMSAVNLYRGLFV